MSKMFKPFILYVLFKGISSKNAPEVRDDEFNEEVITNIPGYDVPDRLSVEEVHGRRAAIEVGEISDNQENDDKNVNSQESDEENGGKPEN